MVRTKNRVTGVVIRDHKILLIHRHKNGDEYWVFPGGGVEDDETLEQGLNREMVEETGLKINSYTLLYSKVNDQGNLCIFYHCQMAAGEPVLGGPELEVNSPQNSFVLEWVDKTNYLAIKDIYPKPDNDRIINLF